MSARPRPRFLGSCLGLFALGLLGVLSLPVGVLPLVEEQLARSGAAAPSHEKLLLLTMMQPTLLLALASAAGCYFAPRMRLHSLIDHARPLSRLRRNALLAAACGVTIALVFTVMDVFVFRPRLDELTVSALEQGGLASTLAGVLYGGITEEIIARWGAMSLLAWLGWRVFQRSLERASPRVYYAAIVLAALLFAVGHLPAALQIAPHSATLVTRTLVLNTAAGLVFGWLYWRHNLETAMLAHASVHVAAAALGAIGWS